MNNKETYQNKNQAGLTYKSEILEDLVNKDTDGDGVLDWEEGLWGTDLTKKETAPGIADSVAIEKLKTEQENSQGKSSGKQENEKLTQTDQFSRDLFTTVAAATQDGQPLDQATVDKMSSSLADHIQNSPPRKVYTLADIKIIKSDTFLAVQRYNDTLNNIFSKTPIKYTVMDILQKFIGDGNNVNVSVLPQLDPIIKQINGFINKMVKMETPQSLATLHLDVINGLQRIVENLNDIKLYDTDVVVALGGISKYETNTNIMETSFSKLTDAIEQKLND